MHDTFAFVYQHIMFLSIFLPANTCFKTFSICGIVFIFATTNIACIAQLCVETRGWKYESGISATLNDLMNLKSRGRENVETPQCDICTAREWEKMNPAFRLGSTTLTNQRSMTGGIENREGEKKCGGASATLSNRIEKT